MYQLKKIPFFAAGVNEWVGYFIFAIVILSYMV